MNLAEAIKTEPLLFDKMLEPISEPLNQFDQRPFSQASKKLFYASFVRVLLFRVFDYIPLLARSDIGFENQTRGAPAQSAGCCVEHVTRMPLLAIPSSG